MGKDTSTPPTPDYVGAAQAQGAANEQTARVQGRMNNPNVYTPYGSQTVTWGSGSPVFNESAYNQAMTNYNNALSQYNATGGRGQVHYGGEDGTTAWYDNPNGGTAPVMPTRDQFTTSSGADQPTVTQSLAPAQQQLLDAQNNISLNLAGIAQSGLGRVGNSMGQSFDISRLNPIQTSISQDPQARQHAEDMAYQAATSRLDPQWAHQAEMQRASLANQGLVAGDDAYDAAMRDFNNAKNDAYLQAQSNAVNQGLNNQTAQFNMNAQNAAFGNNASQQQLQLESYLRSLPLNELNSLRTGSQVTNPQFQGYNPTSVSPAPIMQGAMAQGQANQNAYNANQASNNAFMGGLMQLGGAAMMAPTGTFGGPTGLFSLFK